MVDIFFHLMTKQGVTSIIMKHQQVQKSKTISIVSIVP
jgi:hypothetical protein